MTRHRTQVRVLNALAAAVLFLVVLVLGAFLFGANLEKPYLRYGNVPFPAVTGIVRPGQAVQLTVERCNDNDSPRGYLVTHQLRNVDTSAIVVLPDAWVEAPPGCTTSVSLLNIVPIGTPPGTYEARGRAIIEGRFGVHQVVWQSQPFAVLPKGEESCCSL
jgi:hypothetical protein